MKHGTPSDPRPNNPGPGGHAHDVFPPTQKTWIQRKGDEGDTGRAEINHHIMSIYSFPLRVYFQGTSDRQLGEPDEVINGFFENRLSRPDFLAGWFKTDMRLRRWLINAFCYYLLELRRERRKANKFNSLEDQVVEPGREETRRIDHAFVVSLVRQAMAEAEAACRAKKLEAHWNLFVAHTLQGRSYADLAGEFKVTAGRAAVMNRTAEQHLKVAVRLLLERDGVALESIDQEIHSLLEESGS